MIDLLKQSPHTKPHNSPLQSIVYYSDEQRWRALPRGQLLNDDKLQGPNGFTALAIYIPLLDPKNHGRNTEEYPS